MTKSKKKSTEYGSGRVTFNFDKNQGRTLYNFTKQENTEVKSCCDFRIERNNRKRYTLSIKGKDASREIAKRLFVYLKPLARRVVR